MVSISYKVAVFINNKRQVVSVDADSEQEALSDEVLGIKIVKQFGFIPYRVLGIKKT